MCLHVSKSENSICVLLQDGVTPLGAASQEGHLEIVKRLIEAGADVNCTSEVVENKKIL